MRRSRHRTKRPQCGRSPYGCAKAFATQLVRVYRQAYGLFVCNGILYNHESPRRGENFVTRKIARAAARISHGLDQELVLGNTSASRDWGHARDYVEAMWLMLQHRKPDDYVVATGDGHSVADFVAEAFAVVHLKPNQFVRQDPSFERPLEPAMLVGSPKKIARVLGWKPRRDFRALVREMVEAELAALGCRRRVNGISLGDHARKTDLARVTFVAGSHPPPS